MEFYSGILCLSVGIDSDWVVFAHGVSTKSSLIVSRDKEVSNSANDSGLVGYVLIRVNDQDSCQTGPQ
ncbi:hypothetical protein F8M41_001918 [Gigaspora margarita]|uniref:Uncharacterized protein n=1 Tax=Gigaspora margarita TaxID=4874 RepID=A0A8H3XED4_GIGMA|nr:hypothetical protein F8M41_001918 [Gigaspora margarita]